LLLLLLEILVVIVVYIFSLSLLLDAADHTVLAATSAFAASAGGTIDTTSTLFKKEAEAKELLANTIDRLLNMHSVDTSRFSMEDPIRPAGNIQDFEGAILKALNLLEFRKPDHLKNRISPEYWDDKVRGNVLDAITLIRNEYEKMAQRDRVTLCSAIRVFQENVQHTALPEENRVNILNAFQAAIADCFYSHHEILLTHSKQAIDLVAALLWKIDLQRDWVYSSRKTAKSLANNHIFRKKEAAEKTMQLTASGIEVFYTPDEYAAALKELDRRYIWIISGSRSKILELPTETTKRIECGDGEVFYFSSYGQVREKSLQDFLNDSLRFIILDAEGFATKTTKPLKLHEVWKDRMTKMATLHLDEIVADYQIKTWRADPKYVRDLLLSVPVYYDVTVDLNPNRVIIKDGKPYYNLMPRMPIDPHLPQFPSLKSIEHLERFFFQMIRIICNGNAFIAQALMNLFASSVKPDLGTNNNEKPNYAFWAVGQNRRGKSGIMKVMMEILGPLATIVKDIRQVTCGFNNDAQFLRLVCVEESEIDNNNRDPIYRELKNRHHNAHNSCEPEIQGCSSFPEQHEFLSQQEFNNNIPDTR